MAAALCSPKTRERTPYPLPRQILSALFFFARLVKLSGAARSRIAERPKRCLRRLSWRHSRVVYRRLPVTRWRSVESPAHISVSPAASGSLPQVDHAGSRPAPHTAAGQHQRPLPRGAEAKLAYDHSPAGALALRSRCWTGSRPRTISTAAATTEVGHAEAGAAEKAQGGGEAHLPNWITIANDYAPDSPIVHWMHENEYLSAWLARALFLLFVMAVMKRSAACRACRTRSWIVETENVCGGMLGNTCPSTSRSSWRSSSTSHDEPY